MSAKRSKTQSWVSPQWTLWAANTSMPLSHLMSRPIPGGESANERTIDAGTVAVVNPSHRPGGSMESSRVMEDISNMCHPADPESKRMYKQMNDTRHSSLTEQKSQAGFQENFLQIATYYTLEKFSKFLHRFCCFVLLGNFYWKWLNIKVRNKRVPS